MASHNIEIEAKVLLSKQDYQKILTNIKFNEDVKIQENYFLDSPSRILKKYNIIIRLRQRDGFKLTLKAPLSEGLLEKNQIIDEKEATALIKNNIFPKGDIYDFLEMLHIKVEDLKILASLTTERKESTYENYPINISKNTYGKKVDYELEIDSDSKQKSEELIKSLCNKLNITFKLNNLSKENRAISETINN